MGIRDMGSGKRFIPGTAPAGIDLTVSPLGRMSSTHSALFDVTATVRLRLTRNGDETGPHSLLVLVRPSGTPYFSVQCADWPPTRARTWPIPGGLLRRSVAVRCTPIYAGNGVTHREQAGFNIYAAAMDAAAVGGMFARLPQDETGIPFFTEIFELKDFYPHAVFSPPAVVKADWDLLKAEIPG